MTQEQLDKWESLVESDPVFAPFERHAILALITEVRRLRGLVREAFIEGLLKFWMAAGGPVMNCDVEFDASKAVAKLKGGGA